MKFNTDGRLKNAPASEQFKLFRSLSTTEIQIFVNSIHRQLQMFTHDELINLIQIGYVAVNIESVYELNFEEDDVFILFAEDSDHLEYLLSTWNLTGIMTFLYFHDSLYPSKDEEAPLENPNWHNIISMSRGELVLRIEEYMYPMFLELFKISFSEHQDKIYGM